MKLDQQLATLCTLPAGLLFLCSNLSAQVVSANPVGQYEVEIPAHSGDASTLFLLNLPFLNASIYSGAVNSINGARLNLASANLVADTFVENDPEGLSLYHVEFLSGEASGLTLEIIGNDASSITLSEYLSPVLNGGEQFYR